MSLFFAPPLLFLSNNGPIFWTLLFKPIFWTLFIKFQTLKKYQVNLKQE